MNILLLSAGGGGGNILRSLKASFKRDLAVTQQSDSRYAERLRRAVTTRFLDTNEFALSDVPKDERFLIGTETTGRLGARHDPDVARHALNESRSEVEALFSRYSIVILVGTGGKGTGAGTMFPLAQMAREQKKLVIPIFVRPSFERHEVDKRHYDHAVNVIERFDSAGMRLIEILNDRGYVETRSAVATDRVGTDEPSHCQRAARADLRPVGSLAGGSVRSLGAVCRKRPVANRLRRDRSSGRF